ncbi:MAG: methyltransferase [Thermoplasmata archaeon]|nr:methyltransferase [Thermoplasmata archaeon]
MERIRIEVFDGVYEPAEDSYMMVETLKNVRGKALDMGTGTGIIAIHLALMGCDVTAVDINEMAIKNTIHNARINNVKLNAVKSDLFENVEGRYDIITFNPPYLPTQNEDIAWDGGKGGIEVIDRFLSQATDYMKDNAAVYMIMSSLGEVEYILKKYGNAYEIEKINEKSFFFERISVYRFKKLNRQQ